MLNYKEQQLNHQLSVKLADKTLKPFAVDVLWSRRASLL